MTETNQRQARADFGLDAPQVVLLLVVFGSMAISLGIAARAFLGPRQPWLEVSLCTGGSLLLTAILMVWGSKVGKISLRDRVLDRLSLRGDERVLDVGCGRGLFLIGVAKRLTTGQAVGVDLWQTQDQSGNGPEVTLQNARAEGVANRIELKTGDARQLPFEPNTFDLIVSSWALHNIYDPLERSKALREIARVLKPGGRIAIIDIRHTAEYAGVFRESGLQDIKRSAPNFLFLIPSFTLLARKAIEKHGGPQA
jgi:SAM-dependent methyltransferase